MRVRVDYVVRNVVLLLTTHLDLSFALLLSLFSLNVELLKSCVGGRSGQFGPELPGGSLLARLIFPRVHTQGTCSRGFYRVSAPSVQSLSGGGGHSGPQGQEEPAGLSCPVRAAGLKVRA